MRLESTRVNQRFHWGCLHFTLAWARAWLGWGLEVEALRLRLRSELDLNRKFDVITVNASSVCHSFRTQLFVAEISCATDKEKQAQPCITQFHHLFSMCI